MFAGAAALAVLAGYGFGFAVQGNGVPRQVVELMPPAGAAVEPWYRTRPAPPALVGSPDRPIFPEPAEDKPAEDGGAAPALPYEEALPTDVHEPAPIPMESVPSPERRDTVAAVVPSPPDPLPTWRRYAVATVVPDGRPMIAVVIDDMGVDRGRSARAVALRPPLTLAFLTYAEQLAQQTAAARAAGHELMLHVAMEPSDRRLDPGPNVLLTGISQTELMRRLTWGLDRFHGYVGVNNHMGSRFTVDPTGMTMVMEELRRRGLLFLDSRTAGRSVGALVAHRVGVPFAERNVFLDNDNEVGPVVQQITVLEGVARRRGHAIAIGHPRDATLAALAVWLPILEARGFVLVPVSAIVALAQPTG